MSFEWDFEKAEANFKKHGVRFAEACGVFEDDYAIAVKDEESDSDELRWISIGTGFMGRVLVVVYCYRNEMIRLISARTADTFEQEQYEENR
jgi:uncharacterized DUF497 family protein